MLLNPQIISSLCAEVCGLYCVNKWTVNNQLIAKTGSKNRGEEEIACLKHDIKAQLQ